MSEGAKMSMTVEAAVAKIGTKNLLEIADRLDHARSKHPKFAVTGWGAFMVIESEVNELRSAFYEEPVERQRDECLDVVATCVRFLCNEHENGSISHATAPVSYEETKCGSESTPEVFRGAESKNDPVNHPPHYTSHPSGVECIQITEHMGFCLGNAMKYIWRADLKHDAIEDLKKARWYIEREIAKREKEQ